MSTSPRFDLLRDLRDHEILDSHDESCGMVDDVELEQGPSGIRIAALWVGPDAWISRLPALARVTLRVVVHGRVRVPFDLVARVGETIRLRCTAAEARLGAADRRAARWLGRIPGT